jgi:hypothetical protein
MPYEMTWLVDKRVLYVVLTGELVLDELHELVTQSREMTDNGINPVHAIADATRSHSLPKHINGILKEFKQVTPQDTGFTVIIANNALTRFFAQTLLKIMRLEVRFAPNVDEALNILHRVDQTIPITFPQLEKP